MDLWGTVCGCLGQAVKMFLLFQRPRLQRIPPKPLSQEFPLNDAFLKPSDQPAGNGRHRGSDGSRAGSLVSTEVKHGAKRGKKCRKHLHSLHSPTTPRDKSRTGRLSTRGRERGGARFPSALLGPGTAASAPEQPSPSQPSCWWKWPEPTTPLVRLWDEGEGQPRKPRRSLPARQFRRR